MRVLSLLGAVALIASSSVRAAETPSPRAVVEATFAAVNRHDATALAALYADDAVIVSSDSCKDMIGPKSVRAGHEALIKAMPDLRDEVTDWIVEGNRVAVLFTAHSKSLGPTGKMQLADIFTVKNGKIIRDVTIFNSGAPCH